MRLFFFMMLMALPLAANEIGISAPDGNSGWLLLENPPGAADDKTSEFAGDPGFPVPDVNAWPYSGSSNGAWPTCELWRYDSATAKYTRTTHVLGKGETSGAWRRTLTEVFEINGTPYVLHYDPLQTLKGLIQVLRADALATAGGAVPETAIVLNSAEFIDAAVVSPDRRHVAFRSFRNVGGKFIARLAVYAVADWKLTAQSPDLHAGRPVWIDNQTLAVVAWDEAIPRPAQRDASKSYVKLMESHEPAAGRLLRLEISEGQCHATELLKGTFPPDRLTANLLRDALGFGLVVARGDGTGIVVEMREPTPQGRVREIARFEKFRGMSVSLGLVRSAGVRTIEGAQTLVVAKCERWGEAATPLGRIALPFGDKFLCSEAPIRALSADAHGGMLDLGRGVNAFVEPVVNPSFNAASPGATALLRHALFVPAWQQCDSLRNPRQLTRLSRMVQRFDEVSRACGGNIPSTLLIFDIDIAANEGQNQKKGRYIELYGREGRSGKGRIRTEDSLGGSWLMQSVDEEAGVDYYYDCSLPGTVRRRKGADAGKVFDDLIVQLETRKLLTLTGVERRIDDSGVRFLGRDIYRDPNSGASWRVWVYERFGRQLDNGGRERVELRFVASLPEGTAGDWKFPHALARARLKFALAGNKDAAVTDLAFEPDKFIELPNLTDIANKEPARSAKPALLMPAVFRIYEEGGAKPVQRLLARAVQPPAGADGVDHPQDLVRGGKIRPGYDVPLVNYASKPWREVQR